MTCYVSSGTLNSTNSTLTDELGLVGLGLDFVFCFLSVASLFVVGRVVILCFLCIIWSLFACQYQCNQLSGKTCL